MKMKTFKTNDLRANDFQANDPRENERFVGRYWKPLRAVESSGRGKENRTNNFVAPKDSRTWLCIIWDEYELLKSRFTKHGKDEEFCFMLERFTNKFNERVKKFGISYQDWMSFAKLHNIQLNVTPW